MVAGWSEAALAGRISGQSSLRGSVLIIESTILLLTIEERTAYLRFLVRVGVHLKLTIATEDVT